MTGRPRLPINQIHDFEGLDFTPEEVHKVVAVLEKYRRNRKQSVKVIRRHIAKLKRNGVLLDDLEDRLDRIVELGRDSSSLESLQLRYGDEAGACIFAEKNAMCSNTRATLEKKFGIDYVNTVLKSRGASLDNYKKRHGPEKGMALWDAYLKKRSKAYADKHENGYCFARLTKDYYCRLHGEQEGLRRWHDKERKRAYGSSKQRYIDEFGEVLGENICRKIKTTVSAEKFVERHGEIEGLLRYNKFLDRQAQSRTYTYQSKASNNFLAILTDTLNLDRSKCVFGRTDKSKSDEKMFYLTESERLLLKQRVIAVDFFYENKIIEFNGDVFHGNPEKFKPDDRPNPWDDSMTAKHMWERDRIRKQILEGRGYSVLYVWESEVFGDIDLVVQRCANFLGVDYDL